jgi:hypothetical protein
MAGKIEPKCNGWKGACISIVIGSVFVAMALDMQFFRILGGWNRPRTIIPFIVLCGMGVACVYAGLKSFFSPLTYFSIDQHGVTVFSRRTSRSWDPDQKKLTTDQRRGEEKLIPWALVNSISAGRIAKPQGSAPAVHMAVDPSINLEGYSLSGMIEATTGESPADLAMDGLQPMTETELSEKTQSRLIISASLFPSDLESTVKELRQMKSKSLKTAMN